MSGKAPKAPFAARVQKRWRSVFGSTMDRQFGRNFEITLSLAILLFIGAFLFIKIPEAARTSPIEEPLPVYLGAEDNIVLTKRIDLPPAPPRPKLPSMVGEAAEGEIVEDPGEYGESTFNELTTPAGVIQGYEPPPPKEPPVFEFYAVEKKPVLISLPGPRYPEAARLAGVEGEVVIRVRVDTLGFAREVSVMYSTAPALEQAALKAASSAQFSPGQQGDIKVEVFVAVPFRFRLAE